MPAGGGGAFQCGAFGGVGGQWYKIPFGAADRGRDDAE